MARVVCLALLLAFALNDRAVGWSWVPHGGGVVRRSQRQRRRAPGTGARPDAFRRNTRAHLWRLRFGRDFSFPIRRDPNDFRREAKRRIEVAAATSRQSRDEGRREGVRAPRWLDRDVAARLVRDRFMEILRRPSVRA